MSIKNTEKGITPEDQAELLATFGFNASTDKAATEPEEDTEDSDVEDVNTDEAADDTENEDDKSDDSDEDAEVKKWKANSRKNEQRATENYKALQALQAEVKALKDAGRPADELINEELAELRKFKAASEKKEAINDLIKSKGLPASAAILLEDSPIEQLAARADALKELTGLSKSSPAVKPIKTQGQAKPGKTAPASDDDELIEFFDNL